VGDKQRLVEGRMAQVPGRPKIEKPEIRYGRRLDGGKRRNRPGVSGRSRGGPARLSDVDVGKGEHWGDNFTLCGLGIQAQKQRGGMY